MTLLDRLLGRMPMPGAVGPTMPLGVRNLEVKAVTGAGADAYFSGPLLSSLLETDPQQRAAAFLKAYKVGWFNKAERKISGDIAALDWSVSDGDVESEDPNETTIQKPDLDIPFEQLNPIEQLIRLLERPNPNYTGKTLWQKTQIRRDMAGTAFWYLENGADGGLPTAIYGISPSRMWPSYDKAGQLIGWVMDRNTPSAMTFEPDEIIAFPMASTDDDQSGFGVGVVEAVYSQISLSDLIARHATDLLTTGGRLAGMLSPKDRSLDEDEYQDTLRAWRNVASDPNAARRLLVFPEPMEWQSGAADPSKIGLPELAALTRDEILTAFPIGPEQLGVPMAGGLNASGETRKELNSLYWSGTIHPRVDDLEEVIQVGLLSRYERVMGQTFDFDFDEPDLDDASSLMEKVAAYKALVSSGFDDKEARQAAALDHIKYVAVPAMLDPVQQAAMAAEAAQARTDALTATVNDGPRGGRVTTTEPVAKAEKASRESVTDKAVPFGARSMTAFFAEQRDRLATNLRRVLPETKAARKAIPGDWWDQEAEDEALKTALRALYLEVGSGSLQVVADRLGKFVFKPQVQRILKDLLAYGGNRITEINQKTHDAVLAQLTEGVRRGYSINQLIEGFPEHDYAGVKQALLDNGMDAFGDYRAELISRTETMLSFNRSSISGYKDFGVREVQATDGDGDEECAARDGEVFEVDEAYSIEDHPNGTLDWIPVIPDAEEGKSAKDETFDRIIDLVKALKVEPPHLPAPIVNVSPEGTSAALLAQGDALRGLSEEVRSLKTEPPVVNVPAPIVNVPAPIVSVAPAKAADVTVNVDSVRVVSMPERKHRLERDKNGKPVGSTESDA